MKIDEVELLRQVPRTGPRWRRDSAGRFWLAHTGLSIARGRGVPNPAWTLATHKNDHAQELRGYDDLLDAMCEAESLAYEVREETMGKYWHKMTLHEAYTADYCAILTEHPILAWEKFLGEKKKAGEAWECFGVYGKIPDTDIVGYAYRHIQNTLRVMFLWEDSTQKKNWYLTTIPLKIEPQDKIDSVSLLQKADETIESTGLKPTKIILL